MHALWNWLSHKSELFQVCLCLREWWAGPSHGMWQSKSVPKFSYEIFFTHKKNLEQGQGGPKRSNGQRRGSCYLFKTILPGGQPLWPHNVCAIGHYTSGDEDDGHQQPMRERSLWVCEHFPGLPDTLGTIWEPFFSHPAAERSQRHSETKHARATKGTRKIISANSCDN